MSKYKGIDKETILKIKDVRFPLARKDVEIDLTGLTDNFDIVKNALESHYKKVANDTEMSIICEMAMKYLDEFKAMDDNKTEAYNKGLNDGYELGKKLWVAEIKGGLNTRIVEEIFDCDIYDVYTKYTPQEALAKLEAYEKEQNEIKVGDVVTAYSTKGIVTNCDADFVTVISKDGISDRWAKIVCKKTGKYINIQSALSQIAK